MTLSLLGSATWSVPDFVRTDLRTVRLAIACGDLSDRVMHPSQVAGGDHPPSYGDRGSSQLEINQPRPKRERASLEGSFISAQLEAT